PGPRSTPGSASIVRDPLVPTATGGARRPGADRPPGGPRPDPSDSRPTEGSNDPTTPPGTPNEEPSPRARQLRDGEGHGEPVRASRGLSGSPLKDSVARSVSLRDTASSEGSTGWSRLVRGVRRRFPGGRCAGG